MSDGTSAAPAQQEVQLPTDRLWKVHQAAAYLGVSTSWVYKAAESGELPRARGMAWQLRFVPAEVEAYARGARKPAEVVPIDRKAKGG